MALAGRDALLGTKLVVPAPLARSVDRDRLRLLLDGAVDARLVLVAAPAGFGKSTMLAAWIGRSPVRSAWLSLDPGDNDTVRFARLLGAAADRLAGRAWAEAEHEPAQPFDPELALGGVLDAIDAAVADGPEGGAVLVLDDYHVIGEPAIHRLVSVLVDRLPHGARLAIATRADPPLPLARLRARGELLEVRAEGLRFTEAEAGELLRSAAVELDPDEVAEVAHRTEGWAAALRLAAVSLRGRPDRAELVRRFGATHRFVLDYVVEEVLTGLPAATHEFLLRTSVLERMCGPLCDAVTGRADGQARLEELDRANLLIVPLDDERCWYRYHALFAEVLRARLRLLHPGEVAQLHAGAAAWFEASGDDDQAIAHAFVAGDAELTGRLVAEASGRHLNAGELGTVRRWLDALPAGLVRGHAQLSASYAWCLVLVNELDGVDERLADAERAFADGHDGGPAMRPGIPAQLAMLRSQAAGARGDSGTAVAQARAARELVPTGLPSVVEATLRGTATALLALALLRAGALDEASAAYESALPDLRTGGNRLALGRGIADLAGIAIARGDAAGAVRLCETELALPPDESAATAGGAVWAALARARAELGSADLAEAAARRALELAIRAGDAPVARSARETLARVAAPPASGRPGPGPLPRGGAAIVEALTAREVEVLRLVALGRSNAQIAGELFVTVGTVKSHVHAISGKLAAANRVEAVARGRDLGLLG